MLPTKFFDYRSIATRGFELLEITGLCLFDRFRRRRVAASFPTVEPLVPEGLRSINEWVSMRWGYDDLRVTVLKESSLDKGGVTTAIYRPVYQHLAVDFQLIYIMSGIVKSKLIKKDLADPGVKASQKPDIDHHNICKEYGNTLKITQPTHCQLRAAFV